MGKMIVSIMTSMDGFIEGPNRELDWFVESPGFDTYCDEMLAATDSMLWGRRAYELMVTYWPAAEHAPDASARAIAFAKQMNALPKLVLSRTLTNPTWANTRVVGADVGEELTVLKQRATKNIMVFAGAGLLSTVRRLGLIDEYRMIVQPIVLGRGTPMFTDIAEPLKLRPKAIKTLDSGVTILSYEPN